MPLEIKSNETELEPELKATDSELSDIDKPVLEPLLPENNVSDFYNQDTRLSRDIEQKDVHAISIDFVGSDSTGVATSELERSVWAPHTDVEIVAITEIHWTSAVYAAGDCYMSLQKQASGSTSLGTSNQVVTGGIDLESTASTPVIYRGADLDPSNKILNFGDHLSVSIVNYGSASTKPSGINFTIYYKYLNQGDYRND